MNLYTKYVWLRFDLFHWMFKICPWNDSREFMESVGLKVDRAQKRIEFGPLTIIIWKYY